jgi:hypothetical protein
MDSFLKSRELIPAIQSLSFFVNQQKSHLVYPVAHKRHGEETKTTTGGVSCGRLQNIQ